LWLGGKSASFAWSISITLASGGRFFFAAVIGASLAENLQWWCFSTRDFYWDADIAVKVFIAQ
jgi:hypothetical protein